MLIIAIFHYHPLTHFSLWPSQSRNLRNLWETMSPPLLADLLLLYNVLELDINLCKVIDWNVFGPGMEWFGSRRAIIWCCILGAAEKRTHALAIALKWEQTRTWIWGGINAKLYFVVKKSHYFVAILHNISKTYLRYLCCSLLTLIFYVGLFRFTYTYGFFSLPWCLTYFYLSS